MKRIPEKLVAVFLFTSIFLSFLLYKDSLGAYFFQDDWFTLRIAGVNSLTQIFQFFVPRSDVIYYRPLGMQMPFFILRSLFGVNPLPFHVLTFATHAVNILLVFILIRLLIKDATTALLSAFMYGTSAIHYTPMFWPSTYAFVLGPAFFFLSFILYILSLQKKEKMFYLFSVGVFTLGLLTNEMVVVLPPVLLFYELCLSKINVKKLLPYFLIGLSLFIFRFIIFPPPVTGSYQIGLSKDVLLNLRAYVFWSFNWPEEMKAQFVTFWKVNSQFVSGFSWYFWSFISTFFVSVLLTFILPLIWAVKRQEKKFVPLAFFNLSWFVICLLPVVFFTQHSFSYYLPISLAGSLFLLAALFKYLTEKLYKLNKNLSFVVIFILLLNWIYSSFVAIDFNSKVHWAPRRAKLAKSLIEQTKQAYPLVSSYMAFVNPSSENKLALNDQDALKIIYNSDSFLTIYGEETEK